MTTVGIGRRLLVLVMAAAGVIVTGGCETVEFGGATGVSVDATGAPVAVLAICEGNIDGLELYSGEGDNTVTHGDWQRRIPASGFATVELARPADGWTSSQRLGELKAGEIYGLFGGTRDNRWATAHVTFTLESLARLRPGEVLRQAYDETSDRDRDVITSVEEFRGEVC
jgi:hypothetical protein